MIVSLTYKSNQILWLVFKVGIAFLSIYFIYDKLKLGLENNAFDIIKIIGGLNLNAKLILCLAAVFSMFNWIIEIYKWQLLASIIKPTSWTESAKQSLTSLTISLFTPNRIGEYGAKAIFFKRSAWKKVLLLNAIGNGYQLFATLGFGLLGVFFFYQSLIHYKLSIKAEVVVVFIGLAMLLISVKWLQHQIKKLVLILKSIPFQKHLKIALLAFTRYLIFSIQFCLIVYLFYPQIDYVELYAAVTLIYSISSLLPIFSLVEFLVKGSVAIWVFSLIHIDPAIAFMSTLIMWTFNFAIPSMIGIVYLVRLKPTWN